LLMPRITGWLLDHGADVNVHAHDGSSPLDGAGVHRKPVGRSDHVYMGDAAVSMRAIPHGLPCPC